MFNIEIKIEIFLEYCGVPGKEEHRDSLGVKKYRGVPGREEHRDSLGIKKY